MNTPKSDLLYLYYFVHACIFPDISNFLFCICLSLFVRFKLLLVGVLKNGRGRFKSLHLS